MVLWSDAVIYTQHSRGNYFKLFLSLFFFSNSQLPNMFVSREMNFNGTKSSPLAKINIEISSLACYFARCLSPISLSLVCPTISLLPRTFRSLSDLFDFNVWAWMFASLFTSVFHENVVFSSYMLLHLKLIALQNPKIIIKKATRQTTEMVTAWLQSDGISLSGNYAKCKY